jgi:preprotein translocase subunit YajC
MLTSGIYGEIKSIDGDRIVIETTPGTKLSVIKLAVREIVSAPEPKAKKATEKAEPNVTRAAAAKPAAKKTAK